jgi:hypothetical protein
MRIKKSTSILDQNNRPPYILINVKQKLKWPTQHNGSRGNLSPCPNDDLVKNIFMLPSF